MVFLIPHLYMLENIIYLKVNNRMEWKIYTYCCKLKKCQGCIFKIITRKNKTCQGSTLSLLFIKIFLGFTSLKIVSIGQAKTMYSSQQIPNNNQT